MNFDTFFDEVRSRKVELVFDNPVEGPTARLVRAVPLLTAGAIETIKLHGSQELKEQYLAKMVSGEWTGTMNLTESQAGSDLAALLSKAIPHGSHYLVSGQKI
jgi:alkylation response protein AidB-like acyl-CoA dehydrogenase